MLLKAFEHIRKVITHADPQDVQVLQSVITFSDCLSPIEIHIPGIDKNYVGLRKIALHIKPFENNIHIIFDITSSKQFFTYAVDIPDSHAALMIIKECCELPFRQVHVQTPDTDLYCKMKGTLHGPDEKKLLLKKTTASKKQWDSVQSIEKGESISPENALPLLFALGICTDKGQIIPSMRDKYRQINHFISLYKQQAEHLTDKPIRFIDCGCGKAYLSFCLLYRTLIIENKESYLLGIEQNQTLVEYCRNTAKALGLEQFAKFFAGTIDSWHEEKTDDYQDILIALHACDTATDDALALALQRKASIILAAPCCHHFVQTQMKAETLPNDVQLLVRDGITKERLGDLLTDSLRRDILMSRGYTSELIEFTPLEHTAKNIMIRARYVPTMPEKHKADATDRWKKTVEEWHVHPKLIELIEH